MTAIVQIRESFTMSADDLRISTLMIGSDCINFKSTFAYFGFGALALQMVEPDLIGVTAAEVRQYLGTCRWQAERVTEYDGRTPRNFMVTHCAPEAQ